MNDKPTNTKMEISESFKTLLTKSPFEKITIKMITDEAGIIRPTFYNYFQDKYELFEWILQEELMTFLFALVDNDMEEEAFKMVFQYFSKNITFYRHAFQVEGQNSFEEILTNELYQLFDYILNKHQLTIEENIKLLNRESLALYYSKSIITILRFWIVDYQDESVQVDDVFESSSFLFSYSFLDLIEGNHLK